VITPKEAIDRFNGRFGVHPGYRALHAKGLYCDGTFTAAPEAAELTRAEHMQGMPVKALIRFSNAGGDPGVPDYVPDARGMAVAFTLPSGDVTDIVSQTAPRFPVRTVEGFVDLVESNADDISRAWKIPLFLAKHREALPTLRGNLPSVRPLQSFATCTYFALHAFKLVDREGGSRHVRYTWVPQAGDHRLSAGDAKKLGPDYLREELTERLGTGPARFDLRLQIAGQGDAVDDPNAAWPEDRETVVAGTLEVTAIAADPEADGGVVVFDPVRVTDGIELTNDPILHYRTEAYSESVNRRLSS
jgi:catalase